MKHNSADTTLVGRSAVAVAAVAATATITTSILIAKLWYNRASSKVRLEEITGRDDACMILMIPSELQDDRACPYTTEVWLGVKLALQAGRNMMDHYNSIGTERKSTLSVVLMKGDGSGIDFATDVDTRNEKLVMDGIKSVFPDHEIIGEESCSVDGSIPALTDRPTWIVDPVDGTTNFACGLPLTCVSIGFCVNGEPTMGVVYAPMTKETYIAVKGFGAWRNGEKISGGKINSKKDLKSSVICFEFGYARSEEAVKSMTSAVTNILMYGCKSCKCLGSGVLDLCYLARGSLDVVYTGIADEGWKPWDYCAGLVILNEAGCFAAPLYTSDEDQHFDIYMNNAIFAASKSLINECRNVILPDPK